MKTTLSAIVLLALVPALAAQDPIGPPSFEVASVSHASRQGFRIPTISPVPPSGRWTAQSTAAADLVMRAYGVVQEQVVGGPHASASVVDRTGLTGTFDVDLDYRLVPIEATSGPPQPGVPAPTAIEGQLGLASSAARSRWTYSSSKHLARPDPD